MDKDCDLVLRAELEWMVVSGTANQEFAHNRPEQGRPLVRVLLGAIPQRHYNVEYHQLERNYQEFLLGYHVHTPIRTSGVQVVVSPVLAASQLVLCAPKS